MQEQRRKEAIIKKKQDKQRIQESLEISWNPPESERGEYSSEERLVSSDIRERDSFLLPIQGEKEEKGIAPENGKTHFQTDGRYHVPTEKKKRRRRSRRQIANHRQEQNKRKKRKGNKGLWSLFLLFVVLFFPFIFSEWDSAQQLSVATEGLNGQLSVLNQEYWQYLRSLQLDEKGQTRLSIESGKVDLRWEDLVALHLAAYISGQNSQLEQWFWLMHPIGMGEWKRLEMPAEEEDSSQEEGEPVVEWQRTVFCSYRGLSQLAGALDEALVDVARDLRQDAGWEVFLRELNITFPSASDMEAGGASPASFGWPLSTPGTITSGFGWRNDPFTGEQRFHGGVDIAAPFGTPIFAVADGVVTVANQVDPWGGGYGYYVLIHHGGGVESLYGHCSCVAVQVGQQVKAGDWIGCVGSSGYSTGPHLHWEKRVNGERVSPLT